MRILVLGGAGAMAAGTIRDLLSKQSHGIDKVIAADYSRERLAAVRAANGGDKRLDVRTIDIRDEAALKELIGECDLCINGVPTLAGYQMEIFEACFRGRKTYVDYGGLGIYTTRQKDAHERWRKAGLSAVISLGADPGLSNVLCRAVADRLDRIDRIGLYWVARFLGPENPVLVPPYAVSTVLAEYARPSMQFLKGKLKEVPPRSLEEVMDLPAPFGRCTFFCTPHSEPLTVPFAAGIRDKGIKEMTWKLSLPQHEHQAWMDLIKSGFGDFDDPIEICGKPIKPADFLDALLRRTAERNAAAMPKQEYHELHFAVGDGQRGDRSARVVARVGAGPHPLYEGYHDAATSMAMSVGAQLLMASPQPGVWAPEELFDTDAFLAEMSKRHFRVEIEETLIERR